MKISLKKIRDHKLLGNKYFIAILLFLAWIIFFDENNLVAHHRNKLRLNALKEQRVFYRDKIEADNLKMEELRSGSVNLEKYAREQFLMTKPDEDLFLVVEK
jgi:cell division protein DivIC